MVVNKDKYKFVNLFAGPENETDKEASAQLTESIHKDFQNIFLGIGCSGVHVLTVDQRREQMYQVLSGSVAYALCNNIDLGNMYT